MNRLPPILHPLATLFESAAQSLTTSLNQETIRFYRCPIRNFLNFLGAQYPQVQSLQQLRRDPHILGACRNERFLAISTPRSGGRMVS
jgi:hypothetical protein